MHVFLKLTHNTNRCLAVWMRLINALNGALLAVSGVMAYVLGERNFLTILAATYVIVFGLLLLMYETRLDCCLTCYVANMGFMFDWRGRLAFYVFAGTLAFGIGVVGIVAGSFTMVNLVWNLFVFCFVPPYLDYVKAESKRLYEEALRREATTRGVMNAASAAHEKKKSIQKMEEASLPVADNVAVISDSGMTKNVTSSAGGETGGGLPSGWSQMKDEGSGAVYYINNSTGEQTWEKPG